MPRARRTYPCACGAEIEGADLARAIASFDVGTQLFGATCPACGAGVELRIDGATLVHGYTYWAGSMHFDEVGRVSVPGLSCVETPEREAMTVTVDGVSRDFPVPAATGYLSIGKRDHAVGRTLATLDLEALGVELRGLQAPGYVPVALDRERPLEPWMRVEVFGTLSARRRAEARVRTGA